MLNASKNPIGVETQVPEITDKFCVGEKVIVRSWDDMAKDAAILSTEHVNHPYVKFDKSIELFCGKKAVIIGKRNYVCELDFEDDKLNKKKDACVFTEFMLKKDEEKDAYEI